MKTRIRVTGFCLAPIALAVFVPMVVAADKRRSAPGSDPAGIRRAGHQWNPYARLGQISLGICKESWEWIRPCNSPFTPRQ